jgi:lipoyl(octanoyl) transferase
LSASAGAASSSIRVRELGLRDYASVYAEMRAFTEARTPDSADELWLVEHPPVFTQGQAGKPEHLLMPGDLARRSLGIRALVTRIEQAMIGVLADHGIAAAARPDAPGVYVEGCKIGSLGLRVSRGCSYHGLSLNVAMDLEPFARINPCGLVGMAMTQLADLLPPDAATPAVAQVRQALAAALIERLDA